MAKKYSGLNPYTNVSNIFFLRYCKYRIYVQNRNLNIVIIGSSGSGKSYSAASFAEMLCNAKISNEFNVGRIHFKAKEFLHQINQVNSDGTFYLGNADCIVLDEAGVNISARDWFTEINKKVLGVIETFRWRKLITILTVPDLTFIDSKARKMLHMVFEMKHILKRQGIAIIKPLIVSTNQRTGEVYYVYYKYKNPIDNITYKITNLFLPIPSLELRNEYEKKKQEFATNYALEAEKDTEMVEVRRYLNPIQKKIYSIIKMEGNVGYKKISEILSISDISAYNNLKYVYYLLGRKYEEEKPIKD